MTRSNVGLSAMLIALSGLAYACGSASLASFGADGSNPGATGGADAGGFTAPTGSAPGRDLTPVDNAVILVHAAKSQAFRLCFENELGRRPQPDSQVMPEANVVGVEVGSAVRLGPLSGAPGTVYLFEEPLIRALYPAFGGAGEGPTCDQLLQSPNLASLKSDLGRVDTNLSSGVHLLAVRGCAADSAVRKYSVAECGAGWTSAKGNLSITEITLRGAVRPSPGVLPAQVVNLSLPLENGRAGRDVRVTFGDVVAPGAPQAPIVVNPIPFGDATPTAPVSLAYDAKDAAIYASMGVRVKYVPKAAGGADAGTATTVLDETLAQIQKQSSPRDIPPTYYAAASNYALLVLGDPNAKLPDGGVDKDERRSLHILAVPVIAPKDDAGTDDGGSPGPVDGGAK
jgi:hypothetical protein